MEAKEAVQAAKNYVADLFADERLVDLGLEEVEMGQDGCWRITVGFSRAWDRSVHSVLSGNGTRSYKVLRVSDSDGRVLSVKDRMLAGSP